MFGRRPDGRRVRQKDAIIALAPYLMPTRVDAQVHSVQRIDCDTLTRYIAEQRAKGNVFSYMDIVIAAYVRTISQNPELNRFISNKQHYARNAICVSLALLKTFEDSEEIQETTIKLYFQPTDTIYDVHNKVKEAIDENRKPEIANGTDKLARFLLAVPGLPVSIVGVARLLDRYGLLPRFIVHLSPFHTSLFVTNMMSLGMPYVNHHVYNFGTTSIFISLGKVERTASQSPEGRTVYKRIIPIGVVSDERITSGAGYARGFGCWRDLLANPTQLETAPEDIHYDYTPEQMPPAFGRRQRRKQKALGA